MIMFKLKAWPVTLNLKNSKRNKKRKNDTERPKYLDLIINSL